MRGQMFTRPSSLGRAPYQAAYSSSIDSVLSAHYDEYLSARFFHFHYNPVDIPATFLHDLLLPIARIITASSQDIVVRIEGQHPGRIDAGATL